MTTVPALDAGAPAAVPVPMPPPGWGVAQALAAVAEAALEVPALAGPADVVRALSTVVVRVGALAVKVHPPGTDAARLELVHAVLADSGVAVTAQRRPVVTSSGVVTVMPWVSGRAADWATLGRALRALHDVPAAAVLPAWVPLQRLPGQVAALPAATAAGVLELRDALLTRLAECRSDLPPGAVHGDVSPDNVLRVGHRTALWVDLDFVARGPREYDLAAAVRRLRAGELTPGEYAAFVRGYGHDARGWPGLEVVDDLCRLSAVGFRLWLDRRDGRPSDWLDEALSAVRAGC